MNIHENARLTPHGRAEMVQRVLAGERAARVAQGAGVSVRTVHPWKLLLTVVGGATWCAFHVRPPSGDAPRRA